VIIVSHDAFNTTAGWRSVIVVPISTSQTRARRGPTTVWLPGGAGSLPKASVAVCHQITTLDRPKLTQRIGALPADLLGVLEEGIKAALDLE
jgi:mRNA-degrading endonuclease toxin of MazEF toxin-antitoxin module